jgi:hypothetical protein
MDGIRDAAQAVVAQPASEGEPTQTSPTPPSAAAVPSSAPDNARRGAGGRTGGHHRPRRGSGGNSPRGEAQRVKSDG